MTEAEPLHQTYTQIETPVQARNALANRRWRLFWRIGLRWLPKSTVISIELLISFK